MFNGNFSHPYNTMAPMQQRLQQYEQSYPPSTGGYKPAQNYIKCQPVTSIDEAKAAMIDFDGSVHVFTDIANGRIYTKQINIDGAAVLNVYELKTQPQEARGNDLEKRVEDLEIIVLNLREELKNDKSNANIPNSGAAKRKSKSPNDDGADV